MIGHFLEHEPSPSAAIRGTVAVLLIVAIVSTLWVPLYARSMPKLGPFPFFYWYQLIWVPLTAALCWIGCLLLRSKPARSARPAAPVFGYVTYIAITALILNLIVAAALTPVFRRIGLHNGYDETRPADSFADPATMPATASGAGTPGRPAEPVAGNRVVFARGNGQMTSQRPTATGPHARRRHD